MTPRRLPSAAKTTELRPGILGLERFEVGRRGGDAHDVADRAQAGDRRARDEHAEREEDDAAGAAALATPPLAFAASGHGWGPGAEGRRARGAVDCRDRRVFAPRYPGPALAKMDRMQLRAMGGREGFVALARDDAVADAWRALWISRLLVWAAGVGAVLVFGLSDRAPASTRPG